MPTLHVCTSEGTKNNHREMASLELLKTEQKLYWD